MRRRPQVGDRVLVTRDEEVHPPRGTWRRYRGRVGTVVQINRRAGEIGVEFSNGTPTAWFLPHELVRARQELQDGPGATKRAGGLF